MAGLGTQIQDDECDELAKKGEKEMIKERIEFNSRKKKDRRKEKRSEERRQNGKTTS